MQSVKQKRILMSQQKKKKDTDMATVMRNQKMMGTDTGMVTVMHTDQTIDIGRISKKRI